MKADEASYRPLKFLDRMEGYNHIVLLYEDQKYADLIIARYFLNGLKKGESCVFFTADRPETIEERLSAEGIDVESYKRIGRLRVYRAKRSYSDDLDALSILKNIRQEATRGMKPPYRFVGRTITDIESKEGMLSGMAVEKTGHEHFREFDNSQMCYYDLSRLEQTMKDEWIRGLLRNHHQAIYASEPDRAVAFETTLLEVGE
jgi:hypothetical protein